MTLLVDFLSLFIVIITLVYLYLERTYSYWKRHGIKSFSGINLFWGHFKAVLTQQESIGLFFWRVYQTTTEPFLGVYGIMRPILFIKDPKLVRTVLIKDFAHFSDRNVHCNENYDPLSAHLFALTGQKWKNMREKLTPAFTSGKLKGMFSTIVNCGSTLQDYLDNLVRKNELLDIREISARHSTNIIASVAFGIDVDTISQPNHIFRENGRKIFESTFMNAIRFFLKFIAPKLMLILRIRSVPSDVENFIKSLVKQNLEYREKNNVIRKDFFQLLIQLRNGGTVQSDDDWTTVNYKNDKNQKKLTINEMCAQTFIFFVAGFETSSMTLSYCLYELAKNPNIQDRVHKEIDTVLNEYNDQLTYESVSDMVYLEKCIVETLRMYPVLPMLNRTCVKEYRIPGTNNIIEKGVEIFISVIGLHRDEQFYNEPNKFDPMRFDEEAERNLDRPFMPFGDGPRHCIGMRLGKLQTKVGLINMMKNFKFELDERHKGGNLEINPKQFLLQPTEHIFLRVSKR